MPVGTEVGQPPWQHLSGVKRIASEFKYLRRCIDERKIGQITNLTTADDNIAVWQFELSNFDESAPAGQQLNAYLKQLQLQYGQGFLLMEVTFPEAYPHEPLFLRVVSPRCVWYTGHVTAGGAICLEVLTNTGTSNGWRPDFCVESIVQIAILNMLHNESVVVKTASGPGGRSGPLRLDLQNRHSSNIMQPYSMAEAKSAFARLLRHHQAHGWDASPSNQAVSEPSRHAMSRPSKHKNNRGDFTAAPASHAHAAGTSQTPAACDKDCAMMHKDHHSIRPSAPSLAQASSALACPPANHQQRPAVKPGWLGSHTTASPDVLPLGSSSSSHVLPPAPDQHTTATATDAGASRFGNFNATLQPAVDLTDSPGDSASSQQQIGTGTSAAVRAPHQPDAACPSKGMHDAAIGVLAPSDVSMEAAVVDLLRPAESQPAYVRHPENDFVSGGVPKRNGLSSEPCRQVEVAEQRAEEHAELAVSLDGIQQELVTLDGSSSMVDSDSLIDLTDDMEDVPGGIATGVFAAPAVPGPLAEAPAPAVAVTSATAAAGAAAAPSALVAASAAASVAISASASASAATSTAASAAAAAEAARVKELEAKLAEFQAQSSLLQAQNMRLASELEKAQQLTQEGARMASLVQPPSNWQAHAQGQTLLYIELPISEGAKQQGKRLSDAELKTQHKGWFYDMSTNEVDMMDALAALRKHNGNEEAALGLILESLSNGGVANYLKLLDCTQAPSSPMKPIADACDRELEAETETVMQLWEEHGGLGRHQITGIRRVQNMPLWTKYALTRADIQQARPELSNGGEMWLFHGAHKTCVEAIASKGFDTRVSNRGMLGQGIYFANCSSYSDKYARYGPDRADGMPAPRLSGPRGCVKRFRTGPQAQHAALTQPALQRPPQQQATGPNQGQGLAAAQGHPQPSLLHQGAVPLLRSGHALSAAQHAAASLAPGGWSDPFTSASAAAAAGSGAGHRAAYSSYISSLLSWGPALDPPLNRPFTRPARQSLAPAATDAAVGNPVSDGDAHAQVVAQLLASRNRSHAFWSPNTAFTQAAQAVPWAPVNTAAALAGTPKPDDTATLPADSAPGSPKQTSSLRRRDISMEEHRQQVRQLRCRPRPEAQSLTHFKASAEKIVVAAMARLAAITPAVNLPDPQDIGKTVPPSDSCHQTSTWAPKAQRGSKDPPSLSQGVTHITPLGSQGGMQAQPSGPHADAQDPFSRLGTQNRFSGSGGVTEDDPMGSAAAMPPPAPRQPVETAAVAAPLPCSLSSDSQDMHSDGAGLLDLPDLEEDRPRKQRVKLGDPGGSNITESFRQVSERAVAKDPSEFQDLLHDCPMFSSADKALALSGTPHDSRKRTFDSTLDASKQQSSPAGAATTATAHPTLQSYVNMEDCKAGAQHGDWLASPRLRVAVRKVPVKTRSASRANPGAEAQQPNVSQADKTLEVAAASATATEAATAAEGQQQQEHMPASSAVAPEPNQARPDMAAAPLVTSSSTFQAEARPVAGCTARGGQQGSGLPQGVHQGAELPPGFHQGLGEGPGPAKKLKQARNSRNLEAELRPPHAYRLRSRAAPSAVSLGQKTSQDGLQPNSVNSVEGQVLKAAEEGLGSVQKGSDEGNSGKEPRADKGKGERRGKHRGDRQGRGKGTSVQQGAASDGPAGAILLGSALDAATDEATSRAGPQLPTSPPHQVPHLAPHPVHPPAAPKVAAAPSTAATSQQSAGVETGGEELTILLSRVALGTSTRGSMTLRRPPEGYDSTTHLHFMGKGRSEGHKMGIYCIYDNAQAYPDYIITYKAKRAPGLR